MAEPKDPWREKYRRVLAQQEQLEKTLSAHQGLLQRAVFNLSAAAEGQDEGLDERLQAIRNSVKRNEVAAFDRMIKSLPRVAEEAEERHLKAWKDINKILGNIANQVQQQSPEIDVKPGIKYFKDQLPKGMPLIPATLQRVLQQLSDLQQQAVTGSPKQSGLFGKLFKGKAEDKETEKKPETEPPEVDLDPPEEAEWEEVEGVDISLEGEIVSQSVPTTAFDRERPLPEAMLKDAYGREQTPVLPGRVSTILVELLDNIKIVPSAEKKAKKARQRIDQGLKWFELAPTLEDVRDFILQAYISADIEYRKYLEHLYGELSVLLESLGISIETEQHVRNAVTEFSDCVRVGVNSIQKTLEQHEEINQLKQAVGDHMQQLQEALTNFSKQTEEVPVSTDSLSDQLKLLVDQVQRMEREKQSFHERLEEEKQRAITDSLTGLPNREAYNEKVYQEMIRWERYQHPLSLAVIDIDYFKKFNDNYGHQIGDKVLKVVSSAIAKRLRKVDFIARFGGEEFVLILPETPLDAAQSLLNQIREALAKVPFRYRDEKLSITVSIGISEFLEGDSADTVFARADEALYEAKESGRNCCKTKIIQ